MVILYSTGCPKCAVLEKKLNAKGIEFDVEHDEDIIMDVATKAGVMSLPLLAVDDELLDFNRAVNWVNAYEE